jgi:hypothetical protein
MLIPEGTRTAFRDGKGHFPQPSGGTFSASSSDRLDVATSSGPPPVVNSKTLDQSTSNLDRTLTFTYTLSGGASKSRTKNVTARKFAYATNNNPSNLCSGYGTEYYIVYTVYTHPDKQAVGSEISGVPVTEAFNPNPIPCGGVTGNGALDMNGQFTDHAVNCSSMPLTCSGTATQTIAVAGYTVRTNTVTLSSTGDTIQSDGPSQ